MLAGGHWPVQTRASAGQVVPQPPSTLPQSRAPFSAPHAHPLGIRHPLQAAGDHTWVLGDWQLASATKLPGADGEKLSQPTCRAGDKPWMPAVVPGTVLTTLVARGVYPDPAYGLNNMAIPESLHEHDWWYRTCFTLPAAVHGRHLQLTFNGINYTARVWVNGHYAGRIQGAFIRGRFDVTKWLRPGQVNAIAVRMSPVPNPGVPHEESLEAGPGDNGGMEALDGPTFIASEGWDWIPSIRDRDTGIWQNVTLQATGAVRLGDPHVVTRLPVPDLSRAAVDIDVPLHNQTSHPVHGTLHVSFGNVHVDRRVVVPASGKKVVHLGPSNAPQLEVRHPRLWWPNGYGKPHLYTLTLRFDVGRQTSDTQSLQFGIRQISYELSLFDATGNLRRVLITPDRIRKHGKRLVNVTYKAIHRTRTPHIWAYSLQPGAATSPALKHLESSSLSPFLVIRVNGVRIAIKGGSWGTDDFMKRVSGKSLEPYFKLQKQAHFDVIRNWVGQSTEPAFYRLADKYGMLVLNDFWQSTQGYNLEPMDDALFLRNAADVIKRYRNHPSVALWFGRNEGVPQPLLNKKLDKLIARLDGTRLYMPSSNDINLWTSGPYNYRPPGKYFTSLGKGFAVEIGTPSFPTWRAFKAMMPKPDQWPVSDDWAYHGWHQSGNGDVHSFMQAMRTRFGKPTSLEDFERKAQMMNYVDYRAIFEGFNANLWTQNSGRLLWMSHPAWPNTTWQIYSHDYDTQASYYGVKKAAQPIHVQMNLPDREIAVINNTRHALTGASVDVQVYGLSGDALEHTRCNVHAAAGSVVSVCPELALNKVVDRHGVAFVSLILRGKDARVLSRNVYWSADQPKALRQLDTLPPVNLKLAAARVGPGHVRVRLVNPGNTMALNTKITLLDAQGKRILPAFYSDNYVSLVPDSSRIVDITVNNDINLKNAVIDIHGWNEVQEQTGVNGEVDTSHASHHDGG